MALPASDPDCDTPERPLLLLPHDADREEYSRSAITRRIYISHFLSTWNSRVFEFGAVLYLAYIFPDTLLPMSVYALARGIAAVLLAPAVGHYIDTEDRLAVVRCSIGG